MAKVYRLHEGQDGTGWFSSKPIGTEELKTIKTEGKDVATSIPSPFARVDLVKSAFKWVAENGIDGTTAHHKLVSDALDVAQLFYASQKFASKIQIVAWNPKERLKDLVENGNTRHSKFAATLRLFWNQDSVPNNERGNKVLYNFESVNRLYFLLNKESNTIIGGTSPATLFFASPDVKKATANLNIRIGQDKLFDDEYASLAKRETSFVEYIYTLAKQPKFADHFPEVFSYLEEIRENILSAELRQKVSNFDAEEINAFTPCPVLDNENDPCEILGIPLGIQTVNGNEIEDESDFVVKSDYQITGVKPLILPYHKFSKKWTYTTKGIIWDENTKIPVKNTFSSKDSKLPIQHDSYYWLTIGNFFEDKIVELPYPIDDIKFKTCGSKNHLLPLTPTFFKYFSAEKVTEYLKIEEKSGGLIQVELNIPVKGGKITFKKNYSTADRNIEKFEIHLAVFPFLKADNSSITYTLGLLDDRLEKNDNLLLSCYNKGKELELKSPITRNPGEGGELKSIYYKSSEQFDLLKLGNQSAKGFIVPILKQCSGNNQINFAIDFGTTNTHIEYKYGDNDSTSFDNTTSTPLWQSLIKRNEKGIDPEYFENEITFEQEMLPYSFSKGNEQLQFPLRTALVHNRLINFNENIDIIRQVNNYLLLENRNVPNYLELNTQIKWSNYADTVDEKKVESFIEFLATLVFYKTLLLGGNTNNTTITWFYPVSMDEGELGVFFKLWKRVYKKVFNQEATDDKLKGIPESIAPYMFYKSSVEGLSLSIDIGGGSSDIAVFDEDEDKAKLISSFKFAGNAIFGDGYPSNEYQNNSDRNGFVRTFKEASFNAIKGDKQKEGILNNILNVRKNSSDFSSYLFALEKDSSINFSYSRLLEKDKRLKLTHFVFYGAIAYYSAILLKKSGIGIPKYILLSGTASKSASILDSTDDFSNLSAMFKFIFEKVNGKKSDNGISIRLSQIPKEVTCKGALKANISESIKKAPVKFWIGGMQDDKWGAAFDKELNIQETPKYGDVNDSSKSEIEKAIKDFYSILDEYINTIRLESKFIIEPSAYQVFKDTREKGIKDYLIRGIKAYYKKNDVYIEESLFFYPLIGILNKLSYALSEKQNNDE
ncbi:hypothetical protein LR002_01495 [Candidatus Gracilibacteria bacterium]|nr:hypothetical protein [Candidatus Gracilibacteria bacterium]